MLSFKEFLASKDNAEIASLLNKPINPEEDLPFENLLYTEGENNIYIDPSTNILSSPENEIASRLNKNDLPNQERLRLLMRLNESINERLKDSTFFQGKKLIYITDIEGDLGYLLKFLRKYPEDIQIIKTKKKKSPKKQKKVNKKVKKFSSLPSTLKNSSSPPSKTSSNSAAPQHPLKKYEVKILNPDLLLVFGGDLFDHHFNNLFLLSLFLELKMRYLSQVFFILGNRDINKLRLLALFTPLALKLNVNYYSIFILDENASPEPRENYVDQLKFLFKKTMGSPCAFEHHKKFLYHRRLASLKALHGLDLSRGSKLQNKHLLSRLICQAHVSDNEVVLDYLTHLNPLAGGLVLQFLALNNIVLRLGNLLFLHGAVTDHNYRTLPGSDQLEDDLPRWVELTNKFFSNQLEDYILNIPSYLQYLRYLRLYHGVTRNSERHQFLKDAFWDEVSGYGHQQPGSAAVQMGSMDLRSRALNPTLIYTYYDIPAFEKQTEQANSWLERHGVDTVVVGHKPNGDAPLFLRNKTINYISLDTCYSNATMFPISHFRNNFHRLKKTLKFKKETIDSKKIIQFEGEQFCSYNDYFGLNYTDRRSSSCLPLLEWRMQGRSCTFELTSRGFLSDRSTYEFQISRSEKNTPLAGQIHSDGWIIKATGVFLEEDQQRQQPYVLLHKYLDYFFFNRLLPISEISNL